MSPGFQYDAPWMVRACDPNYLRAVLLRQAREADKRGKHILAATMRADAETSGDALFQAALYASSQVRS